MALTTLLLSHAACLNHLTVDTHPEHPARLVAVLAALEAPVFAGLIRREAPLASIADIALAHTTQHIAAMQAAIPQVGLWHLDPDTVVSPGSWQAALRAAGAVIAAVEAVVTGEFANAFCAVRPPGHHAEPALPGGFCLFNNVAIGALLALRRLGLRRVAIVDFDVHHGNGTQAIVWDEPGILYASTHQWSFDRGTGASDECGAHGNVLNLPLPAGAGSNAFRTAIINRLIPCLSAFAPELILISAGFDAHRDDPLGGLILETADYGWIGRVLADFAAQASRGRLVASLEGGYNCVALGASVAAFVQGLMGSTRS